MMLKSHHGVLIIMIRLILILSVMLSPYVYSSYCDDAKKFLNTYKDAIDYYLGQSYSDDNAKLAQQYLKLRMDQLKEALGSHPEWYEMNCNRLLGEIHKLSRWLQEQSQASNKKDT